MREHVCLSFMLLGCVIIAYTIPFQQSEKVDLPSSNTILSLESENLVRNPSFEEGSNGKPYFWVGTAWSGYPLFEWANDSVKTGLRSLKITSIYPAKSAWQNEPTKRFDVTPGEAYIATAWVKTENLSGYAVIAVAWFDDEKWLETVFSKPLSINTDWTMLTVTATAPSSAKKAAIELHLEGTGTVWYDDVYFGYEISSYESPDGSWFIVRSGLKEAVVNCTEGITLKARFDLAEESYLAFGKKVYIDTSKTRYLVITWRTSANTPPSPGLFIWLDTLKHGRIWQPTGMSTNYTTTIVDLESLAQNDIITTISIALHPWATEVPPDVYQVQVRDLYLSSRYPIPLLALMGSSIILLFSVLQVFRREFGWTSFESLSLFSALISLLCATWLFFFPYYEIITLKFVSLVTGIFASVFLITKNRVGTRNHENHTKLLLNEKVILLIGLLLIPWLAFCLRLNLALTNIAGLFCDELSYGLMSWGILVKHMFIGAHLPGPWQQFLPEPFTVEFYPSNLPLPYTYGWMEKAKIVYPFFGIPYLLPLLSTPFISTLGFTTLSIRLPYILTSVAGVICVFLIGRRVSPLAGITSSAFLAVSNPLGVTYGSKAFVDNGVTLFFLLTILLYLEYRANDRRLYLAAATAGLTLLSKLGAICAVLFLLMVLRLDHTPPNKIIRVLGVSLSIFSTFIISGILVSYKAFIESMRYLFGYGQTLNLFTVRFVPQTLPALQLLMNNWETAFGMVCFSFLLTDFFEHRQKQTKEIKIVIVSLFAILLQWSLFSVGKQTWLVAILPIFSLGFGYVIATIYRYRLVLVGSLITLMLLYLSFQNFQSPFFAYYRYFIIFSFIAFTLITFGRKYANLFAEEKLAEYITERYVDICIIYVAISLVTMATIGFQAIELM